MVDIVDTEMTNQENFQFSKDCLEIVHTVSGMSLKLNKLVNNDKIKTKRHLLKKMRNLLRSP